jgi:hypothetical protein
MNALLFLSLIVTIPAINGWAIDDRAIDGKQDNMRGIISLTAVRTGLDLDI